MPTRVPSPAASNPLTPAQSRKLRRLLLDAASGTPMYQALYEPLGLGPGALAEPGALARLPLLTKDRLLAASPDARINPRFPRDVLVPESTTGSSGQPFTVYNDRRYVRRRNWRFLRALWSVGYRPWHRFLLLTDRYPGFSRHHGWFYQSVEQSTRQLLAAYERVRPDVLYGFTTPLRLLAASLAERGAPKHRPRLVVSTAEMLDRSTAESFEQAFGCPVADFYGMTEMGLVAWRPPGADRYVVAEDSVLLELLPDAAGDGRYRVVLTNLDLWGSPVIRFDCGDLARATVVDGRPAITAFEGRLIDALTCRDGTRMSPYRITDALRDVPGLRRFRVTQQALARFDVAVEADAGAHDDIARHIRAEFAALLGPGLEVQVTFHERLIEDGALKFRPVESRVGAR